MAAQVIEALVQITPLMNTFPMSMSTSPQVGFCLLATDPGVIPPH